MRQAGFAAPAGSREASEGICLSWSERAAGGRRQQHRAGRSVSASDAVASSRKPAARPDSMTAVLRNGPFLRLWMIQAVTQILQNVINFALLLRVRSVVEVHDLPQANTAISLVILAFSLPAVFFGPIAGVVADRVNKRTLMAVLNVARA